MRVVLDTNLLISALMSHEGLPIQTLELWTNKRYDLVTSTWQIEELRRVSRYDRVKAYVNRAEVGALINSLQKKALVLSDVPEVNFSPDPDDNPILAVGIAGRVHYIVSGDKRDLLALRKVESIPIVTAREFVEMFIAPE